MSVHAVKVRIESSKQRFEVVLRPSQEATIGDILRELRRDGNMLPPPALVLVCGADEEPVKIAAPGDLVAGLSCWDGHHLHVHDNLYVRPKYVRAPHLLVDHASVAGLPNDGEGAPGLSGGEGSDAIWSLVEKHDLVSKVLVLAAVEWPHDGQIREALGLFMAVVPGYELARDLLPALDDRKWPEVERVLGIPTPPVREPEPDRIHLTTRLNGLQEADVHQVVAICQAGRYVPTTACRATVVADLIKWGNHRPDEHFALIEDALNKLFPDSK